MYKCAGKYVLAFITFFSSDNAFLVYLLVAKFFYSLLQSYYAVYKVFKKSGPGPKNGEQYGAPFKEEEWVDDEFCDFNFSDGQEMPAEKPKMDATDIEGETCQATHFSLDDFDRWMKQISDEDLFQSLEADPFANSLSLVSSLHTIVFMV